MMMPGTPIPSPLQSAVQNWPCSQPCNYSAANFEAFRASRDAANGVQSTSGGGEKKKKTNRDSGIDSKRRETSGILELTFEKVHRTALLEGWRRKVTWPSGQGE